MQHKRSIKQRQVHMSNKTGKQVLLATLRFPEFREAGKWETGELGNAYIFVKMFMLAQDRDIADLITYEEGR
jgi:hypothetical protein